MPASEIVSTPTPKLEAWAIRRADPDPRADRRQPGHQRALASAAPSTDQRGFSNQGDLGAFQLRHGFTVTNTNDSGPGSLRQTLIDDLDQTTIGFAPALAGLTITLTSGPILLDHDIKVDGSAAPGLTISGGNAGQIFLIGSGPMSPSTT